MLHSRHGLHRLRQRSTPDVSASVSSTPAIASPNFAATVVLAASAEAATASIAIAATAGAATFAALLASSAVVPAESAFASIPAFAPAQSAALSAWRGVPLRQHLLQLLWLVQRLRQLLREHEQPHLR